MIAIDRDHYEPDLRGKAFINLKNIPNGHYTIFYIRIGQHISINSRLKVLGRAKGVYVNIKRPKKILARWQNIKGEWQQSEFDGYNCKCFLHELDHLEGIVFQDRVSALKWALAVKKSRPKNKRK
jgi:hypothetical protein